jgi:hypothetical protein
MTGAFLQVNYKQKFFLSATTGTNSFLYIFNSKLITFIKDKKNKHIDKITNYID